jgi:hypothetical protein
MLRFRPPLLRSRQAPRTGAYFSLAPFIGAVLAISALGDSFTVQFAIAGDNRKQSEQSWR